ncbi:substrate-binding periplasmic protein [Aliivibrio wodanis]|uniref:substrate-binding periplasmic protein n=1 Tax=Aliivibrio wodanis TaxID=80852 RepID=UPI00406D31C2
MDKPLAFNLFIYIKKQTLILISSILLLSFSVQAVQKVEIYTYDSLPPFSFRDENNNLTGIYIEAVKKIAEGMPNYDISFKVVPWSRAKALAEQGQAFAILPPYYHAHDWLTKSKPHRSYLWPYSQPIFAQTDVVICKDNVKLADNASFPQDFTDLSFASMRGDGRAGSAFVNLVKAKKINLNQLDTIESAILFFLHRNVDCIVSSQYPFYWYLGKLQEVKSYELNDRYITVNLDGKMIYLRKVTVIATNYGHLAYTDINSKQTFPFKKDFSIQFDIGLYQLKKSGEMDDIINEMLNFN